MTRENINKMLKNSKKIDSSDVDKLLSPVLAYPDAMYYKVISIISCSINLNVY